MKQDMAVLQRVLEQKERKMQDLMRNTGQVPALKQHYDRVLQVWMGRCEGGGHGPSHPYLATHSTLSGAGEGEGFSAEREGLHDAGGVWGGI